MAWVWPPNTPQEKKKKCPYKRPVYERDQLKVEYENKFILDKLYIPLGRI